MGAFDEYLAGGDTPAAPKPVGGGAFDQYLAKEPGDFSRGFKTAFQQLPQLSYGLAALGASTMETALGEGGYSTAAKNWATKHYKDWGDTIALTSKETDDLDTSWDRAKGGDYGALVDWLQYGLGYTTAQGAQMLATAGAGAVAGRAVGKVATQTFAAGLVAKEAEALVAAGVAESVKAATPAAVANVAGRIGQWAGVGAMAYGQEGGEIGGDLAQKSVDEGRVLTGAELAKAFAATALAGSMEFASDALGLNTIMGRAKFGFKDVPGVMGRLGRAGAAVAVNAPIEGATEYGQTLLEEWGKGNDATSPEAKRQAFNAAGLGALGGAAHGVVGGLLSSPVPREGGLPEENPTGLVSSLPAESSPLPPAPASQAAPAAAPMPTLEPVLAPAAAVTQAQTVDEAITAALQATDPIHMDAIVDSAVGDLGGGLLGSSITDNIEKTLDEPKLGRVAALTREIESLDAKPQNAMTQAYRESLARQLTDLGAGLPAAPAPASAPRARGWAPQTIAEPVAEEPAAAPIPAAAAPTEPQTPAAVATAEPQSPAEVKIFGKSLDALTDAELKVASRAHRMSAFREAARAEIDRRRAGADQTLPANGVIPTGPPEISTETPQIPTIPADSGARAAPVSTARPGSTFLRTLKQAGGIHQNTLPDMGQEKGHRVNRQMPGLVSGRGMNEDALVEWLGQNGYVTQAQITDADQNRAGGAHELARDLVRKALGGEEVVQLAGEDAQFEAQAQAEYEAQEEAYQAAKPADWATLTSDEQESELDALFGPDSREGATAESAGGAEKARTGEVGQTRGESGGVGASDRQSKVGVPGGGREQATDVRASQAAAAPIGPATTTVPTAGTAATAEQANLPVPPADRPSFTQQVANYKAKRALELKGETEAEIRAREERAAAAAKAKADEEAKSEAKRKADAERADFNLSGSDRTADANPNQSDIFAMPSQEVAQAKAIEPSVELDAILSDDDRQQAATELGDRKWTKATAQKFLAGYAEWLQQGAKKIAGTLGALYRKVLAAGQAGALSIAVAFNFNVTQYRAPVSVPVTQTTVTQTIERPRADFNGVAASGEARLVADWMVRNDEQKGQPFIIADKTGGMLYAFDARGALLAKSPALFGAAKGDFLTPAQAAKTIAQTKAEDKLTPAGRFAARGAQDSSYGQTVVLSQEKNSQIALHRVYLGTPGEKRMERLQSETPDDNRVSYGCINALPEFIDQVVAPHFTGSSQVIVLPETMGAADYFGIDDATTTEESTTITSGGSQNAEKVSWGDDKYNHEKRRGARSAASTRRRQDDSKFSKSSAPTFYSDLTRRIEQSPSKFMPAQAWKDYLRGLVAKGVKQAEIDAVGINEWLDLQEGKIPRATVVDFLQKNGVQVIDNFAGGGTRGEQTTSPVDQLKVELDAMGYDVMYDIDGDAFGVFHRQTEELFTDAEKPADMDDASITSISFALAKTVRGLDELPQDVGEKVDELSDYIMMEEDPNHVAETVNDRGTRYGTFVLPGAKPESYRELLLTLPIPEPTEAGLAARALVFDKYQVQIDEIRKELDDAVATSKSREAYRALMEKQSAIEGKRNTEADKAYTLPEDRRIDFNSSHFDKPNILAHVRFDERTDTDGKRVLFLEELQSDWAQEGRKKGFRGVPKPLKDITREELREILDRLPNPTPQEVKENYTPYYREAETRIQELIDANRSGVLDGYDEINTTTVIHDVLVTDFNWTEKAATELQRQLDNYGVIHTKVPSAPFVTKTEAWTGLVLKRMIRYAADNGFDRVAWTTGEQQTKRYDLSSHLDELEYRRLDDGRIDLIARKNGTSLTRGGGLFDNEDALEEHVGKEIADKIRKNEGKVMPPAPHVGAKIVRRLSGLDLTVGGEGMRTYYDKIIPNVANDILKKLGGGKVSKVQLELPSAMKVSGLSQNEKDAWQHGQQPGFDITPAMRDAVLQGQPLFSKKTTQAAGGVTPTQFSQAIANAFGGDAAKKLLDKVIVPVASQAELPARAQPFITPGTTVYGYYDAADDKTYAVLENLKADDIRGLVMHEVGVHYGFEGMLGKEKMTQVLNRLDIMAKAGNATVKKAQVLAEKESVNQSQVREETLAYLVQEHPQLSVVAEAIASIRAFLFREFGMLKDSLTEADIAVLVKSAVKNAGRMPVGASGELIQPGSFHKAFHGSPHDFDTFTTQAIGTGEGAQAYGWGMYFAGRKEVAEHYRNALSTPKGIESTIMEKDGKRVSGDRLLAEYYTPGDVVRSGGGSYDKVLAYDTEKGMVTVERYVDAALTRTEYGSKRPITYGTSYWTAAELRRELIPVLEKKGWKLVAGRLYEVELAPKDSDYLDWDKSLSEQPAVAKILRKYGVRPNPDWTGREAYLSLAEKVRRLADNPNVAMADPEALGDLADQFDIDIYPTKKGSYSEADQLRILNDFTAVKEKLAPRDWLKVLAYAEGNAPKAASMLLNDGGVPGIRYLDGSSRGAGEGHHNYVIFDDAHVKIEGKFSKASQTETPAFSRSTPAWVAQQPADTQEALRKAGVWHVPPTLKARIAAWSTDWQKRVTQGVVDQFSPLKEYDYHAYMLARLSKGSDAALDGLLHYGTVHLDQDGAVDVNFERGGFLGIMSKLNGEHDRFLAWVIGNRAERLLAEGREHNFTAQDIQRLKDLSQGTMKDGSSRATEYARVRAELDLYNKSVLDVAEKAGLIDNTGRAAWEKDFYVPFYRLMEETDQSKGPMPSKGLVNQYAFKVLKGGDQVLGDPMENILKNWSHLLDASLKNQAARESLLAAQRVGVVIEGPEATVRQMAKAAGMKDSVASFTDQGEQRWFMVEDPFLLDAIKGIGFSGFQGVGMKVMGKFKRWLTTGVTISPTFRIRNVIRDSLMMIGTNPANYNVLGNVLTGWKATKEGGPEFASILAGGGVMRFGATLEGDRAEHVKRLIESGIDDQTILTTPEKVKDMLTQAWDWWQHTGDRAENINRAALYKKLRSEGKTHLEASFAARDTMDFSMQGTWAAIRFLSQTVPFFNARLQGLYKLGRGAAEDPRRFGIVVGAASIASLALFFAFGDDDDWKKREDWDRESFWWFKIGNKAFRIPKPFEIGAIATVAERGLEYMASDELTGKQFAQSMFRIVSQQLSMNPVPQMAMPLIELYANRNSFTDRPIESMGMERLSKEHRIGPNTSATAQLLGKNGVVSPVQIDHLVNGYFGWLGGHVVSTADLALRPAMDLPGKPTLKTDDVLVVGDFVKDLPAYQSKYVTRVYDQMKDVQHAMADVRELQKIGALEEAKKAMVDNADKLKLYRLYTNAENQLSKVNTQIKLTQMRTGDPEAKREKLDRLYDQRNRIAEVTEKTARAARP